MMKASAQWGCLGVGGGLGEEDTSLSRRVQADVAWLWGCPLPWPGWGGGLQVPSRDHPMAFAFWEGRQHLQLGSWGRWGTPR